MFTKLDHAAVSVRDMERSIAFYRDLIGMEKVFDREFDVQMAKLIGVEGTQVRISQIVFEGAEAFPASELKRQIAIVQRDMRALKKKLDEARNMAGTFLDIYKNIS